MSDKEAIKRLVTSLMSVNGIDSLEDLGERLGTPPERGRGAKYKKAKTTIESLKTEHLLMLAGLFGVPYEKLKNADTSILDQSITNTNSVNIGMGNAIGDSNKTNVNSGGDPYMDKIFSLDLEDDKKAELLSKYFESKK